MQWSSVISVVPVIGHVMADATVQSATSLASHGQVSVRFRRYRITYVTQVYVGLFDALYSLFLGLYVSLILNLKLSFPAWLNRGSTPVGRMTSE